MNTYFQLVAYFKHTYYVQGRFASYLSNEGEKTSDDDNTDSASYIQTPKPGQKPSRGDLPNISQRNYD